MIRLKPCLFCGGQGKLNWHQSKYYGQNGFGSKKIKFTGYIFCTKCRSRGAPVSVISDRVNCRGWATELWEEMFPKAAEAWNRRVTSSDLLANVPVFGDHVSEELLQALKKPEIFCVDSGDVTMQGWISVEDRLPEVNTDVWCYSDKWGGYLFVGWINPNTGRWRDVTGEAHIGTVTHWMPFPEPPKEEA